MRQAVVNRSWIVAVCALCWCALTPRTAAHAQDIESTEPNLSLSTELAVGFMRGGHGGLFSAQPSPLSLDVQVMTTRAPRYLVGGALRMELSGSKAVAGIARIQLRYPFGPIELRPGAGLPFYFAPRTMLGVEASLWGRMGFTKELSLLFAVAASAYPVGNDIPHGSTVIMLQVFIGAELFI
jgi:hypothetical protein